MTIAQELASYVVKSSYDDLEESTRRALKVRVLDSLGCAIGAIEGEPIQMVREQIEDFGGQGHCTLIGGGRTAPDRAALYNVGLVRYLDFNDFYLAKHESLHPSDNLGAVLAACEYANRSGEELLTSLAVAYHVQCRLSDAAPVRAKGFDHTTQGSYAVAAGVSRALGLDAERTANAVALSGTPFNALRVTRTGDLSHWKGLAYPNTAFGGTHSSFLAMRGVTGPPQVFEGNKGFMESIAGPFEIDWSREGLDRVELTEIKKYNAEGHSQVAIEGILELRREHGFTAADVERVEIDVFDVAFNIIGGGEEGHKKDIRTKEQADHSLPYMVAAAILDGDVMMDAYEEERILRQDVQQLLQRVAGRPSREYTDRFPGEMPTRLQVFLKDGRTVTKDKVDYEGFHTNPMPWESVVRKFDLLSGPYTDASLRREIIDAVQALEAMPAREFAGLLARVRMSKA